MAYITKIQLQEILKNAPAGTTPQQLTRALLDRGNQIEGLNNIPQPTVTQPQDPYTGKNYLQRLGTFVKRDITGETQTGENAGFGAGVFQRTAGSKGLLAPVYTAKSGIESAIETKYANSINKSRNTLINNANEFLRMASETDDEERKQHLLDLATKTIYQSSLMGQSSGEALRGAEKKVLTYGKTAGSVMESAAASLELINPASKNILGAGLTGGTLSGGATGFRSVAEGLESGKNLPTSMKDATLPTAISTITGFAFGAASKKIDNILKYGSDSLRRDFLKDPKKTSTRELSKAINKRASESVGLTVKDDTTLARGILPKNAYDKAVENGLVISGNNPTDLYENIVTQSKGLEKVVQDTLSISKKVVSATPDGSDLITNNIGGGTTSLKPFIDTQLSLGGGVVEGKIKATNNSVMGIVGELPSQMSPAEIYNKGINIIESQVTPTSNPFMQDPRTWSPDTKAAISVGSALKKYAIELVSEESKQTKVLLNQLNENLGSYLELSKIALKKVPGISSSSTRAVERMVQMEVLGNVLLGKGGLGLVGAVTQIPKIVKANELPIATALSKVNGLLSKLPQEQISRFNKFTLAQIIEWARQKTK